MCPSVGSLFLYRGQRVRSFFRDVREPSGILKKYEDGNRFERRSIDLVFISCLAVRGKITIICKKSYDINTFYLIVFRWTLLPLCCGYCWRSWFLIGCPVEWLSPIPALILSLSLFLAKSKPGFTTRSQRTALSDVAVAEACITEMQEIARGCSSVIPDLVGSWF